MLKLKLASLALAFFMTTGWSLPEAHQKANTSVVQVGEWCSGVVIDKDKGLIATAYHCIDHLLVVKVNRNVREDSGRKLYTIESHYNPVNITFYNFSQDGDLIRQTTYLTTVAGVLKEKDVAILKTITSNQLPDQATISDKGVWYGDKVYSLGFPFGFKQVVAEGTVVKPKQPLNTPRGLIVSILNTATISPGSSGGALFNDDGELIGLTNWRADNYYAASPAANILLLLSKLGTKEAGV